MQIRRIAITAAAAWALAPAYPLAQAETPGRALIAAAIAACGGEARLTGLRSLRLDAIGHEWALEQSERPEGPWLPHYIQTIEVRDLEHARLRRQSQTRDWNFAQWSPASSVVVANGVAARTNGQRWAPGGVGDVHDAEDIFAFAPERLLLTARAAPDLATAPAKTLQGVVQDAVTFTAAGRHATLYLNRWTKRPTMLEVLRDDQWGVWGDVTERRWFSFWTLEHGGLWYPRQTTVEWNGLPFRDVSVMDLTVDAPVDDGSFQIPEETKQSYAASAAKPSGIPALRLDETKAVELAPGVVQFAGSWNVVVIRQPDGLVILEAPISAAYTGDVLAAAARRFPDSTVKAVVTTSDAWPHIGGVREYVARGIPVYALDLNMPILERLVKAPRTLSPDTLAGRPAAPIWRTVSTRTTIGTGDRRVELVPVRGELGERMMIAWLPGIELVYTSDLVQILPDGKFFDVGMLSEAADAVAREHLGVPARAVGMHIRPTPWTAITGAVDAAKRDATK